jgi:hypothetical protein
METYGVELRVMSQVVELGVTLVSLTEYDILLM